MAMAHTATMIKKQRNFLREEPCFFANPAGRQIFPIIKILKTEFIQQKFKLNALCRNVVYATIV